MIDYPTPQFVARDPDFKARVTNGFTQIKIAQHFNMRLAELALGRLVIEMDFQSDLTQQNGFLHAGVLSTGMDTACGLACMTLCAPNTNTMAAEFKTNLLAPAIGEKFHFVGQVEKSGKSLCTAIGQSYAFQQGDIKLVASMHATIALIA